MKSLTLSHGQVIYHTQECQPNYERDNDYKMEKSSRLYTADSMKHF